MIQGSEKTRNAKQLVYIVVVDIPLIEQSAPLTGAPMWLVLELRVEFYRAFVEHWSHFIIRQHIASVRNMNPKTNDRA